MHVMFLRVLTLGTVFMMDYPLWHAGPHERKIPKIVVMVKELRSIVEDCPCQLPSEMVMGKGMEGSGDRGESKHQGSVPACRVKSCRGPGRRLIDQRRTEGRERPCRVGVAVEGEGERGGGGGKVTSCVYFHWVGWS